MVHGGILPCGKYKGQFFDEVEQNDSGYCDWVSSLKEPDVFKSFVDYLKDNHEPPNKKQKSDKCKICFDNEIDSVFVPCGHIVSCMKCGLRFDSKQCPICKEQISMVLKTYLA